MCFILLHQWDFAKSNFWLGAHMHSSIILPVHVNLSQWKIWNKSIKFAKYTNTCRHSHSRKEETKSGSRSEWRTHFTCPLCRFNHLTYSMSCCSTPLSLSLSLSCLMHTHTLTLYDTHRVTEAGAQRVKTLIQTLQFILYMYNLLWTFVIVGRAYRRTEGTWVTTISGVW